MRYIAGKWPAEKEVERKVTWGTGAKQEDSRRTAQHGAADLVRVAESRNHCGEPLLGQSLLNQPIVAVLYA
jgi:hypothetical protein